MRKNIKNLFFSNLIKKLLLLLLLFLFSCVYYNTFYNAEVNYKKAEKIIEQTPPANSKDDKIPAQAKKLLGQAIENSTIVINSYPESKYVDDAYFIIGKASFLRKEYFNAEKYLKSLIDLYPNSEYYNEAQVWLIYTYLKMDNLEFAKNKLNDLKDLQDKEHQYLINNILAEIAIQDDLPFEAYNYYNKCIPLTKDKSQKTSIYLNLLNISKNQNHLDSSVVYLKKLAEYGNEQMKKDIKLDWIKYSRKAGSFDDILVEIEIMLGQSEYSSIYLKLELERGKIYLDQSDFESAKIFFSELSEKYSRKNESAEALYHLGYIALMENFDLELALEYFEKSKKDRKTSVYGRRSRDMINRINDYKNLTQELEILLNEDPYIEEENEKSKNDMTKQFMPKPKQKTVSPDSIIFVMSEKLLFDFERLEDSKNNYKKLIEEYPDSKFRPQALYVLNFYFPNEDWGKILKEEYPQSQFNLSNEDIREVYDNIDSARDRIWLICDNSYNICAQEFLKFYNEKEDNLSLYFYAFINDVYLNRIEESINGYQEYIELEPESQYFNDINSRLHEIEDNVYSTIELTSQKINYYYAVESLQLGEALDSVLVKISKSIEGSFSEYKSSSQSIKSKLNKLISLKKRIDSTVDLYNDSLAVNKEESHLDSIYFIIGKIYQLDFMVNDSAEFYFEEIAENFPNSKYRYQSITALNDIGVKQEYWKSLLTKEYPDSLYISDSSYKEINIIKEINDKSFIDNEIGKLELLQQFKSLFVNENDSISIIDTTNINTELDTLNKVFEINEQ